MDGLQTQINLSSVKAACIGCFVTAMRSVAKSESAFEEDPGESVCLLTSEEHYAKLREDSIAMWPLL